MRSFPDGSPGVRKVKAESAAELARRLDSLYLELAHVYNRLGRLLGIPSGRFPRDRKSDEIDSKGACSTQQQEGDRGIASSIARRRAQHVATARDETRRDETRRSARASVLHLLTRRPHTLRRLPSRLSARGGWEALRSGGAAVLGRGRALVEGRGTYYATRSSDLASFLALMCCVLSAAVALVLSLSMYSHLSFWMPSLESQLWYVGVSSKTRAAATIFNKVAIVCCVLGLGYQCAVTGTVAHPRLLFHRERCEERLGAHSRQRVGPPPLPSLGWRAARLVVREADPRARLQRLSRCGARDAPLGEEGRGRRDRAHGC